jgi:hypothetical protein
MGSHGREMVKVGEMPLTRASRLKYERLGTPMRRLDRKTRCCREEAIENLGQKNRVVKCKQLKNKEIERHSDKSVEFSKRHDVCFEVGR